MTVPHPWEGTLRSPLSIYPEAPLPVPLAEPILSLPTKFHWWFSAKAAPGADSREGEGASPGTGGRYFSELGPPELTAGRGPQCDAKKSELGTAGQLGPTLVSGHRRAGCRQGKERGPQDREAFPTTLPQRARRRRLSSAGFQYRPFGLTTAPESPESANDENQADSGGQAF